MRPGGVVYSTRSGRICPRCGWPEKDCRCSSVFEEAVPERITARLRLETKGRAGKSVTVVDGLPKNSGFLKNICQELKRSCGTGGRTAEDCIELQGDQRERLRDVLHRKGWTTKG